ncbi:hypothetical protein DID99_35390 [Burkholderia sp. Bp8986]|nr:hypothetical protein DID99_35390 [Burkholderia sp. Bp8986]
MQVADAIATLAEEQQGASLGALTCQIWALPISERYAAFKRVSAASGWQPKEQIGAQTAILIRQIGWLPGEFREPYFMRFADLIHALPPGRRSEPMEALIRQIECLPEPVRASVRTRVEAVLPKEEWIQVPL